MKNKIALITLVSITLATGFTASGRADTLTNTPPAVAPPSATSLISTNLVPVVSALENFFKDVEPYFGTNTIVQVEAGALYNQGKLGEFGAVKVPINNNVSFGFDIFRFDKQTYYGPFTATIGTTVKIPFINSTVYVYAEDGPTLQFGKGNLLGNQAFVGFYKNWKLSEKWNLNVVAGSGTITGLTGPIYGLGIGASYHF